MIFGEFVPLSKGFPSARKPLSHHAKSTVSGFLDLLKAFRRVRPLEEVRPPVFSSQPAEAKSDAGGSVGG
jgi:hypothetical protein